jgi:hypothetical protein
LTVAVRGRRVRARVTCSAACAVKVTLRRGGHVHAVARRKLDVAGTVVVRFRRPQRRSTLRVSAPGAAPVSHVIRPR